jgi:phosphoribosylformylglycinamidine cyclo-ligase
LGEDEYDVAGATTGVVEFDEILGSHRVVASDRIVCLASSGLHSNGYSLVRHVLLDQAGMKLTDHIEEFGRTLGEELLTPTKVYAKSCLAAMKATPIHAMSHITGGGLANNLARVMPSDLTARIDRATWTPAPVFTMVQQVGAISQQDIEATLNMGVGMVVICPESSVNTVISEMAAHNVAAWDAGVVDQRGATDPAVHLQGRHS